MARENVSPFKVFLWLTRYQYNTVKGIDYCGNGTGSREGKRLILLLLPLLTRIILLFHLSCNECRLKFGEMRPVPGMG